MAGAPALAEQNAYILNEGSRRVTVIDLHMGQVRGHFRTKSNPRDLEPSHDGTFVAVAASNDATILPAPNYPRVDLVFRDGGEGSSSVGLSPDDSTLYVSQEDHDFVVEIDLSDPHFQGCFANATPDCQVPSWTETIHSLPIDAPLHLAVCDDGSVTVVGRSGEVARMPAGAGSFNQIAMPSPVPVDPRGIDCAPNDDVWISSQGGAPLTRVGPGASPVVDHVQGVGLQDTGRVAVDPRMLGSAYTVLVTDRATREVVFVSSGRVTARVAPNNGSTPFGVAASGSGYIVTANQDGDSATVVHQGWYQQHFGTRDLPIDSGIGPVIGAAVEATPHELRFSYFKPDGTWSAPRTMTLESTGTSALYLENLTIASGGTNFQIVGENCTNRWLSVGQSCQVEIRFRATAPAFGLYYLYPSFKGALRATHNGSPVGVSDFPLRGLSYTELIQTKLPPLEAQQPWQLNLRLD